MADFDLVLKNAYVNGAYISDVGIKDGIIASIGLGLSLAVASLTEIIDCKGAVVTPGGVDGHVHLAQDWRAKEASYVCADNFETGTPSAVAGGTTTVLLFAEQSRGDSLPEKVTEYHELAQEQGTYSDYGFHVIITDPTPELLEKDLPWMVEQGITSIKLYLTYKPVRISDTQFLSLLLAARKFGITSMVHAENGDLVEFMTDMLEAEGLTDPICKAVAHPPSAEAEAAYRAVEFSTVIDTPLLIVHVSVPESAKVIRRAQTKLQPVFAETCPQYLLLDKSKLEQEHFCGAKFICSPPLRKDPRDIEAIWQGVANGTFTILSSDHCPYKFSRIPNGMPGVETRMALLFSEGVLRRRCIDIKRFVELTSENPAKLYGLYPKKGAIQIGSDADLVIWHGESFEPKILSHTRDLHDGCDYSPYEGVEFKNWPRITILRGKVVFRDGVVVGEKGYGEFVRRGPSTMPLVKRIQGDWNVLNADP